jgi:hypothetical protein
VSEVTQFRAEQPGAAEDQLAYLVERADGTVLALTGSAAIAYAAYYAAAREYFGQPIRLRHAGVVMASFEATS